MVNMLSNLVEILRARIKPKKAISHNNNLLIAKSVLLLHRRLIAPNKKRTRNDNLTKLIVKLIGESWVLIHKEANINRPDPKNAQYDLMNKWFDTDKLNHGPTNAVDIKNKTIKFSKKEFLSP